MKKAIWSIIIFFLIIITIVSLPPPEYRDETSPQPTQEEQKKERTSGSCTSEMETAIANEYKSPSSVKFISCQWDKTTGIISGEADAENGF